MWKDPWGFRDRFFEQIDKEFSDAEDMLNRMFKTVTETGIASSQTQPYFYGYQITVGPEGKPHIREFGNVRPSQKGLIEQSAIRQPLVDTSVNEKENTLVITAEMPGITKEDVKVTMEEGLVSIHAEKGNKKYHTELPVDNELDADSTKASYINGVLELKIQFKKPIKSKSKEIKVE
ncbi:MAG: Hsp20/alpha crystallin family protein [Nitrososphaeraceae archaeon]|nr:Hsp20/alpha crystallin family protein [Nitrososphaeraceae archaeon]